MTSIAIKEVFNPRLCVYIMDDQNVAVEIIPDDLMRESLEKSSLRLAPIRSCVAPMNANTACRFTFCRRLFLRTWCQRNRRNQRMTAV